MDLFNTENTVYVLDTSALIALDYAYKRSNPMFEAVWEELEDLLAQGRLKIIDFVDAEIGKYEGKEDFVKKWVDQHRKRLVVETDVASLAFAQAVINAEKDTGFLKAAKLARGEDEADPYLIGYAKQHASTIVSHENPTRPNKLPQVASRHGVKCLSIEDFLAERGLKMVRKK